MTMNWKEVVREYLTFTRKDRVGILVVVLLIFLVVFLPHLLPPIRKHAPAHIDSSVLAVPDTMDSERSPTYHKIPRQLFYFDPNTLSGEGWKKLGLKDKTIHTIENYLNKGGHFKKAADLKKVYGLHADEYERLEPYVRIKQVASIPDDEPRKFSPPRYHPMSYSIIDINTADTSAFISLPGIGSKLATRIVNFRDKLGGFYSIDQIKETFGLPDSTFQKIRQYLKAGDVSVKKININTATLDELKAHPYVRYAIANSIISYRNEHGPFLKLEDLKKIMSISEDIYNKIIPYLVLQ